MELDGKVALVTGSGRGIGRAIALAFAAEGARVIVNAIHAEHAEEVRREIGARGGSALAIACDVSRSDAVEGMFAEISSEFGRLDVLVNNAGINIIKPTTEMSESEWDQVQSTNLKSIFLCSKAAAGLMVPRASGRIVNIASIVGLNPFPRRAPYASSKAGVIMLTRELAVEWAQHNIMVNAIAPGFILTDLTKGGIAKGTLDATAVNRRVPMGRFGEPEEVARAVVYLASERAAYITGQCLAVDGGYTANGYLQ